MGDKMRPMSFPELMKRVFGEYETRGSLFGISKIYAAPEADGAASIFSGAIETPIGPAAGPHTQLAQNIIAAYAAGARFFELKTVQIIDGEDLPVSKPCINAADECYNCEWSTELLVSEALGEYIKAWYALKIISTELRLGSPNGFVFNMSVGYDYDGIKSAKIDDFIEGMKNAGANSYWRECREWAIDNLSAFKRIDRSYIEAISPAVSDSITLSTLHGCPPGEIERIASYLLTEKTLHTYVKCNPTLLGFELARGTLDKLGYDYISFTEKHFLEDLQMADAVPMLGRLKELAASLNLCFGVKLTNTFPVDVKNNELPSEEMYMSGRSLFPLSISVAGRLARAFDGNLSISFAGGADAYNINALLNAGIWPVTMATTLLKPGGYQRFAQMAADLPRGFSQSPPQLNTDALRALEKKCRDDIYYKKSLKTATDKKNGEKLPLFDCAFAPCGTACPIGQDASSYIRLAGEGRHFEALRQITERNPLPFITGSICPQLCGEKCIRGYYEAPINARAVKLECASKGFKELLAQMKPPAEMNGKKAAVVGGGPAGMACAYFLSRCGVNVTIFEKREVLGGTVRHIIPSFRISDAIVSSDTEFIKALGVEIKTGIEVASAEKLRQEGFDDIIFATGAPVPVKLRLEYGVSLDAIEFLEGFRSGSVSLSLGKNVVIVGGGNTAMDTARAALRTPGVTSVSLIYRRTRRYMPADEHELYLALDEGVKMLELLSPVGIGDGLLKCEIMTLTDMNTDGRRNVSATGSFCEIPADTLIAAVGQLPNKALLASNGFLNSIRGTADVDSETMYSRVAGAYIIGDARRGPSTVVESIADALKASRHIAGYEPTQFAYHSSVDRPLEKRGFTDYSGSLPEHEKCLECGTVCELCADVCPNRANIGISTKGGRQILHIDALCNECGNCETFCPWNGAPYRDKFTLFKNQVDFTNSENDGFLPVDISTRRILLRYCGKTVEVSVDENATQLPEAVKSMLIAVFDNLAHSI